MLPCGDRELISKALEQALTCQITHLFQVFATATDDDNDALTRFQCGMDKALAAYHDACDLVEGGT
jgi:hypothetical protein